MHVEWTATEEDIVGRESSTRDPWQIGLLVLPLPDEEELGALNSPPFSALHSCVSCFDLKGSVACICIAEDVALNMNWLEVTLLIFHTFRTDAKLGTSSLAAHALHGLRIMIPHFLHSLTQPQQEEFCGAPPSFSFCCRMDLKGVVCVCSCVLHALLCSLFVAFLKMAENMASLMRPDVDTQSLPFLLKKELVEWCTRVLCYRYLCALLLCPKSCC